jgi:MmyB-like transcription regulator ligand binding domain
VCVPVSIEQMTASSPMTPAFVLGRYTDVLAANDLATAIWARRRVVIERRASQSLAPRRRSW